MKIKSQQLIGIAIGLVPLAAYSQEPLYSTIQSVTFALTATWEEAALTPKDEIGKTIPGEPLVWENYYSVESPTKTVNTWEDGSKMGTQKISNKEILMKLVEEGVINSINGYSISVVSQEFDDDSGPLEDDDSGPLFCLTKKGMAPVYIGEHLFIVNEGPGVETNSWKGVETITGDKTTWTESGKSNGKALAEIVLELPINGMSVTMCGVVTWSDTLKSFVKDGVTQYAWMPSSGKFNNVAGSLLYIDDVDNENGEIIEGSISIGAGSFYLPPLTPPIVGR